MYEIKYTSRLTYYLRQILEIKHEQDVPFEGWSTS